jgi:hypothetical protein
MKDNKGYKTYKYLMYFVIGFSFGVYRLLSPGELNYVGWIILAVSFFFLSSFFEQKEIRIKQKKVLIFLLYTIAVGLIVFSICMKL